MTIKRHQLSGCNLTSREHPLRLLRELGLNYYAPRRCCARRTPETRHTNFWHRNEARLSFILHDAWKQYRKLIQKAHPDVGGNSRTATRLNLVWKQTRKLFKQRGVTLAVVALALAGCRTPSHLESPLMLATEQSPPLPPLKAALAAPGSVSGTVNIVWDYPSNELSTNITFKLYHCTNLLTDQFTVFTNVSGLLTSIRLPVEPGVHFFKLTAASLEGFGESDFSEAARCQLPRRGGLEIQP